MEKLAANRQCQSGKEGSRAKPGSLGSPPAQREARKEAHWGRAPCVSRPSVRSGGVYYVGSNTAGHCVQAASAPVTPSERRELVGTFGFWRWRKGFITATQHSAKAFPPVTSHPSMSPSQCFSHRSTQPCSESGRAWFRNETASRSHRSSTRMNDIFQSLVYP